MTDAAPAIWLGDLLRAFAALQPGDEVTRALISSGCGFEWVASAAPATPAPPPATIATAPPSGPASTAAPVTAATPRIDPARPPVPPELLPWTSVDDNERAQQWSSVPVLPPPAPGGEPPWLVSLFRPEWSRVLATTLAATRLPNGPIDTQRLVDTAARGLPPQRIHRQRRWSIALGLELLVDQAPGMEPFAADVMDFCERVQECVGPELVHLHGFANCPTRGLEFEGETMPYRWPEPGVPVLVVTDLGLGGPPSHLARGRAAEWLDYAATLRSQGSALRLLVPHVAARWPAELRQRLCIVEWDRPTTAGQVARLLRDA